MNNGQGRDKTSQTGNQETLFAYDEHRLLGEYDTQDETIQETVWLGNLPVAMLRNGSTYSIHTDHLGTPRAITDNSNTEVWRWESDPFGMAMANEDPDGDGVSFIYNLRFPGQYYDREAGLHYNYFREYDPVTGRYIESDPIGLKDGLNTFVYVANNPIRFIDPTGLCSCKNTSKEYVGGHAQEFGSMPWDPQQATMKCGYRCSDDNGNEFWIFATVTRDRGYFGDPNTKFVCPYVTVKYEDYPEAPWTVQKPTITEFDPRMSLIPEIREEGKKKCTSCGGK